MSRVPSQGTNGLHVLTHSVVDAHAAADCRRKPPTIAAAFDLQHASSPRSRSPMPLLSCSRCASRSVPLRALLDLGSCFKHLKTFDLQLPQHRSLHLCVHRVLPLRVPAVSSPRSLPRDPSFLSKFQTTPRVITAPAQLELLHAASRDPALAADQRPSPSPSLVSCTTCSSFSSSTDPPRSFPPMSFFESFTPEFFQPPRAPLTRLARLLLAYQDHALAASRPPCPTSTRASRICTFTSPPPRRPHLC